MDQSIVNEVRKNISALLVQFKTEEMGNRLTQFNYLTLERFIIEELNKLQKDDNDNTGR